VGGSTDAPFGHPDPWRAIATAIERRTIDGAPLGVREAVAPERALALFLTSPEAPGGMLRRVHGWAPPPTCACSTLPCPGCWRSRRRHMWR
jgi:hypothetical protein